MPGSSRRASLAFTFSPGKGMLWDNAVSTLAFDTVRGVFLIPDNKLESLRATLAKLHDAGTVQASFLATLRGKLLHYGCCLPHIAVAGPSLTLLHGNEDDGQDWQRPIVVPDALRDLAKWLLEVFGTLCTVAVGSQFSVWRLLAG
jgi:hypothetical protein